MDGRSSAARRRGQLLYDDTLSLADVMDHAAENCTLKTDNVCSKFLKESRLLRPLAT